MGSQVRDERQRKAFTGLSPAQCDDRRPVFNDLYGGTQQKRSEEGVASGTRRRKPGGGPQGQWPTIPDNLRCVLSDDKTYPPGDVLGTPWEMARSHAQENLHT